MSYENFHFRQGTYSKIARDIGMHRSHVSKVLNGHSTYSPNFLRTLSTWSGIDMAIVDRYLQYKRAVVTRTVVTGE